MDQFINFLINFAISYAIFKFAFALYEIRAERNAQIEEEFEEVRSGLVTVEKVNQSGTNFWLIYTHEDNPKFLAQGYSEQEAIDNLSKLHPGKNFYQITERTIDNFN